jgi:TolB protein
MNILLTVTGRLVSCLGGHKPSDPSRPGAPAPANSGQRGLLASAAPADQRRQGALILAVLLGLAPVLSSAAAEVDTINLIRVQGANQVRLVPISLSGFSGEVDSVLKFDLTIAGFTNSSPEQAQFLVSGSNNGSVQGKVTDRMNKAVVLSKAYSGGSLRTQAHALADDIVLALLHQPGVAQTKIAFKVVNGGSSEIYLADYDGHNPIALTQDHSIVAAPCWMPGKRVIFYTSYKLNNPDIYSHDLSTGERKIVARYTGLNTSAALSPDGHKVAMILSKGGSPDVYVGDLDGGNLRQLTHTKEDESSPCWSPDSRTICFVSRLRGKPELYTMPAAGGAMTRLSTVGAGSSTEPDWSPDGKTIVFTVTRGTGFEICTVPAQGGQVEELVSGEDPSWASNSRTVVFARRLGGGRRALSLLDVPTKQVKNIIQLSGSVSQPSWAK